MTILLSTSVSQDIFSNYTFFAILVAERERKLLRSGKNRAAGCAWESLESDLPARSAEQSGELDYREARERENPAGVLPWEQSRLIS